MPSTEKTCDRILLIDDDELISGSLRAYLDQRGSACDVAGEGDAATILMAAQTYSAVVVDPYLTGSLAGQPAALLLRIRELQPHAAVFVLTGYGSDELHVAARACGASVVMAKPQPVLSLAQLILETQARAVSPTAQQ